MRSRKRFYSRISLLAALLASGAAARTPPLPAPPPAARIQAQLVRNFERDQSALQALVHREHVIVTKDNAVDARTLRVWYVHNHEVSETIALDDRQLSAAELAAEHRRAMKRAQEAARRPEPPPGMLVFAGRQYSFARLAQDYVYGPASVRLWHGREIWVYPAKPNPSTPARSREEALLLRSEGEVWVDAADLHVIRVDVHLIAPVRYALGLIATIHTAGLELQLARYAPGVWLPALAEFHLQATILLFKSLARSKSQSFFDYAPALPAPDRLTP